MNKYRVTAKLTGNTDDIFLAEVEADNEDEAWAIAYKSQLPRGIYNGKVEELPTREEQAATIAQLREALEQADETVNDMAYIIHDADTNDQEKFEKLEARWMKYPIAEIGSLIDDAIHARALKGGE